MERRKGLARWIPRGEEARRRRWERLDRDRAPNANQSKRAYRRRPLPRLDWAPIGGAGRGWSFCCASTAAAAASAALRVCATQPCRFFCTCRLAIFSLLFLARRGSCCDWKRIGNAEASLKISQREKKGRHISLPRIFPKALLPPLNFVVTLRRKKGTETKKFDSAR